MASEIRSFSIQSDACTSGGTVPAEVSARGEGVGDRVAFESATLTVDHIAGSTALKPGLQTLSVTLRLTLKPGAPSGQAHRVTAFVGLSDKLDEIVVRHP